MYDYVRYGTFTICPLTMSLPQKMAPKFRIAFQLYYSHFDKHNCIDFHRVNCNEPTPSLLDNFLVFVFDFIEICSGNCKCNRLQFFMQIIN